MILKMIVQSLIRKMNNCFGVGEILLNSPSQHGNPVRTVQRKYAVTGMANLTAGNFVSRDGSEEDIVRMSSALAFTKM